MEIYLPQILTGLIGVFGALVGAAVGGAANYLVQSSSQNKLARREAQVLSSAISAEIESIVFISERRQWVRTLKEHAVALEGEGKDEAMRVLNLDAQIRQATTSLWPIYESSFGNLGALGNLSGEVVTFYTGLRLIYGASATLSSEIFLREINPNELAKIIRDEAESLSAILSTGLDLARRLRNGTVSRK